MNKVKHSSTEKEIKNLKYRYLLKILVLFIIVFVLISVAHYFLNKEPITYNNTTESNIDNKESYASVSTKETLVVKGAEFLEISGIYINSDEPNSSTVSAQITNTSNETHENLDLYIVLLDKNNNKLTSLDCKITKISPNEEILTYSSLSIDLFNCVNYYIALKK